MIGVALKVTEVPAQMVLVPEFRAMLTAGINALFTMIGILLLVAINGFAQLRLEVITRLTTCPFVKDPEV